MTYPYKYPTKMRKRNPEWQEQLAWMIATFGRRTGTTQDRWRANAGYYWFKDERDAVVFLLRWS